LSTYDHKELATIADFMQRAVAMLREERASLLSAVLLTGYLGGAIATQVRARPSAFETIFPLIVAALIWGGLFLRQPFLRTILPLLRSRRV
jgi:hypothetical protein